MKRSRDAVCDVMCSECGEPWSAYDANHQPGCRPENRTPLRVPKVRELRVVSAAANTVPRLAARFVFGGRR